VIRRSQCWTQSVGKGPPSGRNSKVLPSQEDSGISPRHEQISPFTKPPFPHPLEVKPLSIALHPNEITEQPATATSLAESACQIDTNTSWHHRLPSQAVFAIRRAKARHDAHFVVLFVEPFASTTCNRCLPTLKVRHRRPFGHGLQHIHALPRRRFSESAIVKSQGCPNS
jgi:hypothetical protein